MKKVLFLSASSLDGNLMRVICEKISQKIQLTVLNPKTTQTAHKKASFDLVILNHCDEKEGHLVSLTKNLSGPIIHLAQNESSEKNTFLKPFDEETLEGLLLKFLKGKKS